MRPIVLANLAAALLPLSAPAADAPQAGAPPAATRAEQTYRDARALRDAQPTNTAVAWQFARACFDECEFSQNNTDRARVANEGIQACRQTLSSDPALAPAHYYLAMDLGQLARTKLLGALGLLDEMEKEWKTALGLDENFDYAGPDRNLGLLYLNAPGWPLSIGSRADARQHLLRAVQLHPEYPENHLNLIEARLKWNDYDEAGLAAKALEQILPDARKKFTGSAWDSSWEDWNKRRADIQKKLSQGPPVATAPHNRK